MKTVVEGIGVKITPSVRSYVEKKLMGPIRRLLGEKTDEDGTKLHLELTCDTHHHKKGNIWGARLTLSFPPKNLRHHEVSSENLYNAIDELRDAVIREIKEHKERSQSRLIRGARRAKNEIRLDRPARPSSG